MANVIEIATKALQESIKSATDTLTSRLTSSRASNLDNLDTTISSRSSHSAQDVANLVSGGGIKSVQRGRSDLTASPGGGHIASTNITISRVNLSKSYVNIPWSQSSHDFGRWAGTVTPFLSSSTNLRVVVYGIADEDILKGYPWEVIEFE
ncbi:hypothetical protein [Tindallia californiensis]|uniref:Uncharacterized protein n=1 Tax=Tindallia californiensis TaxID=159292 RepID=A0A1H3R3P0_9FIRM|nr:hypothetical protein [Tindallia californiensis]SDZ19569.1 hypothetical protein SAMN05192546_11188 [Tindallia californiensis]